ncbi:hypothetical protein E4631_00120 [Hymenobacter sp. UV11]|uniref:BatD family protein n=1 Tax=Hymenobacter sp. UV11 TaxID=1849735 RepID=UPI001060D2D8|nr:BatD family protein [Hymenobacter sp. UV11]TFZ68515.1 hypothetical protein E4631_00120 [Hymenobacter sp. UV11]
MRHFWKRIGGAGGLLLGWLLSLALVAHSQPGSPPAQAPAPAPAQAVGVATLVPPPATVALAEPFTLAFRLQGVPLAGHSAFPDIEGFRKGKLITTKTTRLLPGSVRRTELTVTQQYLPYTEGDYVVPAFSLTVNGQVLRSPGGRVQVGAGPLDLTGAPPGASVGVLDQLLGKPKPKYFYEPPDAAFLVLEADHKQVYVGQGVHVSLYFYLKPADQAVLNFYDFNNQLTELLRQLRQPTTWEVPAPDPSALPDTVRQAGGQVLLRFRLAAGTYYPLTAQDLQFPALSLTMTKFKLLKKPEPGDNERLAIYKTYAAAPLRVSVRALPAPGGVPVGDYVLHEGVSGTRFRTGEAFTYTFGVEGAGNPATLAPPLARPRAGLELFGPDIRDETLPDGRFRKSFRYRLVAHRPGPLALDSLWQLPFFNPQTARYDTLRPELRLVVSGADRPTPLASATDDPFYGQALARADARLQPLDVYAQVGRYAAVLLATLLVVAVVGWWRAG